MFIATDRVNGFDEMQKRLCDIKSIFESGPVYFSLTVMTDSNSEGKTTSLAPQEAAQIDAPMGEEAPAFASIEEAPIEEPKAEKPAARGRKKTAPKEEEKPVEKVEPVTVDQVREALSKVAQGSMTKAKQILEEGSGFSKFKDLADSNDQAKLRAVLVLCEKAL